MHTILKVSIFLLLIFNSSLVEAKRWVMPPLSDVMVYYGSKATKPLDQSLDPSKIRVFVWNMYKAQIATWKRDYPELVKSYDLLLLQEMLIAGDMKEVINSDPTFGYHMATSFIDTKLNDAPSGVAIGSYVMPIYTSFQRSFYLEPFLKTPKMVLFADYSLTGLDKKLRVATIHGINVVGKKKLKHQLDRMGENLRKFKGPVILGGDFNTWSKKKVNIMKAMARRAGLTQVKFPNGGPSRNETFGNYLDHIWVRGVTVLESKVYAKVESSDHKAMSVTVSID